MEGNGSEIYIIGMKARSFMPINHSPLRWREEVKLGTWIVKIKAGQGENSGV